MKHFTISELLYSPIAVERRLWNGAGSEQEQNLMALIENVLDPARQHYGHRVRVSSGFRCNELNRIVGGAPHSQHLLGEAADLYTDEGPQGNLELGRIIVRLGHFDQLIFEHVKDNDLCPLWLHVSWRRNGNNRREIRKCWKGAKTYPLLTPDEMKTWGLQRKEGGASC